MGDLIHFLCEKEPQFRRSRLPALYSDFRQLRATNPDGYAANISAWLQGLASAARAGVLPTNAATSDLLVLTLNQDLLHALETEDGRPLALGTVIEEGIDNGKLYSFQKFMESPQSIYHKGWVPRPVDLLTWSLKQLGISSRGDDQSLFAMGKVVLLENLEIAGKKAQGKFGSCSGRLERVFTYAAFTEMLVDIFGPTAPLSELDVQLLLKYMARDKNIICHDMKTVKLISPNETNEITKEDTAIASLKTLIKDVESQVSALSHRLEELDGAAKEAVAKKNRAAALAALRSKKLTETTLQKRLATLAQLEEIFAKIEQVVGLVELEKVIEASTQVLTGLNEELGGVERAEDTVDKLREQMELVDEVGRVTELDQPVDSDAIDNELAAMEQEEKERREIRETEQKLEALQKVELQALEAENIESTDAVTEKKLAIDTEGLKTLSLANAGGVTEQ
ncbi:hypothetical protein K3495_g6471 [Podosphaera aphanis]|nr:hypothetical protein K3495_g6471 [Podosphaera aphanis]